MLAVIDTNILLVTVSARSAFHWLYKAILEKKIALAFSTDILAEYEEQLSAHWHPDVATNVIRSLLELSTARLTIAYFKLNLIAADEDDNKFVDCAFAANADCIVTNDRDFDVLKSITFPAINVLNIHAFKALLLDKGLIDN